MSRNFTILIPVLGLVLLCTPMVFAQDSAEERGYPVRPTAAVDGVVFSDNYEATLHVARANTIAPLVSARGVGRYWTLSPDRRTIGSKKVLDDGRQVPVLYDIATVTERDLSAPVPFAGQVSFSDDGVVAFTLGDTLVVRRGDVVEFHNLGQYVNIVAIAPDGKRVAFADIAGQMWLMNLPSGEKVVISRGPAACAFPQWSPDGHALLFSGLSAKVYVYDLATKTVVDVPDAFAPTWSPDNNAIVFYRKEISGEVLKNSDLFAFSIRDGKERQLTATPDVCEMDPSYLPDGRAVLYHTYVRRTIASIDVVNGGLPAIVADAAGMQCAAFPEPLPARLQKTQELDIPYVNQVYDTPDWFSGYSACGPTTAAMLLAHYRVVPPWPGWITKSGGHLTYYGRYVCDIYRFRETNYAWQAADPNNTPSHGGFGYMWGNGSPHSYMASYYVRHGISASTADSPPLQAAIEELQANRPYSMCVDLTSAGHIVLAHGYDGNGTLVTNDPYGDKNKPGYPNRLGKNARYDWPGYNNGHVSFGRYVYWAVAASFSSTTPTDTLVDDLQFGGGFFLYNQAPVSMTTWKDYNRGFAGHFWYTLTHAGTVGDSCYATWTPNLPVDGAYEVFAYIPFSNATAACYRIAASDGEHIVEINQKEYKDTCVSLGTFPFLKGSSGVVRLGDSSMVGRQEIVFDAMRWSARTTVTEVAGTTTSTPREMLLRQNYPNPFNPATTIAYTVAGARGQGLGVSVKVYDLLGREVAVLVNEQKNPGAYTVKWDARGAASGVYICRMTAGGFVACRKLVLAK